MSHGVADFAGRCVAVFDGRAEEMARRIESWSGRALAISAVGEPDATRRGQLVQQANLVLTGQIDILVLMSDDGLTLWLDLVERHVPRERLLAALADSVTIAAGPAAAAALDALGVEPSGQVPAPATWREILQWIDRNLAVVGHRVGLVNGGDDPSLVAGLEARGAEVAPIAVASPALPADVKTLENQLRTVAGGRIDAVLFTSRHQVENALALAERLGLADTLRTALSGTRVATVGSRATDALRRHGIGVGLELAPADPETLLRRLAEWMAQRTSPPVQVTTSMPSTSQDRSTAGDPSHDSLFLRACRGEPTARTPIWLMRQAGRYLPEYREIRRRTTFLQLCKDPALCAEVMIRTVQRLEVDAAIIFSDLLPILEPMGFQLEFAPGEGPVIHNPVRQAADVQRVAELDDLAPLDFVFQTVRLTRAGLPASIPVLGFAGAPFTLASYAIEGGASRDFLHTKTFMYRDEGAWRALAERLARAVGRYLRAQVEAGASAVQLFDSWVGCLGPDDYRRYALPYTRMVLEALPQEVPAIHFTTGNPALVPLVAQAGGRVVGVDWRVALDEAWRAIGHDRAIQGNLDPAVLLAEPEEIVRRARQVLDQAAGRPGHIFNLGHGVLPTTPVDHVRTLIDAVRQFSTRDRLP